MQAQAKYSSYGGRGRLHRGHRQIWNGSLHEQRGQNFHDGLQKWGQKFLCSSLFIYSDGH